MIQKKSKNIVNIGVIEGHSGAIYDIIYSKDSLFTSSADKFVVQWNVDALKQEEFAVKLNNSAYNIALSEATHILAIGTNNGGIHVVDMVKKEEVRLLAQHQSSVFSLAHNSFKNHFYSGDRDGVFCVWDDRTFDLLLTYPLDCGKIRKITLDDKGEMIAVCGQDGYIRIFETEYFNQIASFYTHEGGVNCALIDGDILYTGGKDAHIRKWNWKKEELILEVPAHNYALYDLVFVNEGEKLVSVSFDKTIKLWNAKDISIIERVEYKHGGHQHAVNRIAKIDEHKIATVSDDRKIIIWEIK